MSKRRVVITGMGMVSPVGLSVKESWENILAGKSGIAPITHFDTTGFSTIFGGSVKNFDATNYISAKDAKKMDPFIHYGIAASMEAIKDSGLEVTEANAERIGVAVGSGIGGLPGIEERDLTLYAWPLIVFGVACCLPLVLHLVRKSSLRRA